MRDWLFFCVVLLLACGSSSKAKAPPPHRVALEALVLEPVRWVAWARPKHCFSSPDLQPVASALLSPSTLASFRALFGIDLQNVEVIAAQGNAEHLFVVFDRGFDAKRAVQALGRRMLPLESQTDDPLVRRAGLYRSHRFEAVALSEDQALLAKGPPGVFSALLNAPRRKHPFLSNAPIAFMLKGPPPLPPQGIGLVLSQIERLEFEMREHSQGLGRLELVLRLYGPLPQTAPYNLRAFVSSIASTDLGLAFGLEEVEESLRIQVKSDHIALGAELRPKRLAKGLRIFFGATISEVLAPSEE
ncbi:MAG: hypothetical protein NZM37_05080 [Sandaracinaceae bacterium]|nr:hypothetical protein [Sandaracinaceae bacterium]MDW8245162.1 hypothetical protein [Sandaracinaceae bacterium]